MLLRVAFSQEGCPEGGPGAWAGMGVVGPGKEDLVGLWAGNQASGSVSCRPAGLCLGPWFLRK